MARDVKPYGGRLPFGEKDSLGRFRSDEWTSYTYEPSIGIRLAELASYLLDVNIGLANLCLYNKEAASDPDIAAMIVAAKDLEEAMMRRAKRDLK